MTTHSAGRSPALGFWVRHQMAMEAFEYRHEEDPPRELGEIFEDQENLRLLEKIVACATFDGNELVHSIAGAVADEWRKSQVLVVTSKKKSTAWDEKLVVRRKRCRAKRITELGLSIEPGEEDQLHLYCYLWTKGGKRAAIFNAQQVRLKSVADSEANDESVALLPALGYWDSGVIVLAKLPLEEFVEDGCVALLKLRDRALACILRCSASAIEAMLSSE